MGLSDPAYGCIIILRKIDFISRRDPFQRVGQALLQLRPVLSGIEFVGKVEQERGDNDGKDSKKQAASVKIQADGCQRQQQIRDKGYLFKAVKEGVILQDNAYGYKEAENAYDAGKHAGRCLY